MQFKSLQIHGFKSFADKTVIEFPKGITAIVGPNGSGKSNIMDSLRWVFGEQRASELRGGDMEDVIFAGSDTRKAAGYAEVGLTLMDIPQETAAKWGTFSDITISRKIYRTGEREYYINNRKCRLKDIKDIFFDTGLGAKSISIIEQERVTKIVNSTPEELRYFLEETAGVVRYKERRKDAESRLRQTEDNLSRINDLLSIMAADIEKLSAQVEQVKIYKNLRAEKTELEKTFLCFTYSKLVKDKETSQKVINDCRKEMADLVGQNQTQINLEVELQRDQEKLRDDIKNLRIEYDENKSLLIQAESDIKQMEANITSAGSQIEQLNADLDTYKNRLQQIDERMDEIVDNADDIEDLIEDFKEKVDDYAVEMAETRAAADGANAKLKEINGRYLHVTQMYTEASNNINMKQSEIASHKNNISRLQREKDNLSGDTGDMQQKIDNLRKEIDDLDSQINYSKNQETVALEELKEKEEELADCRTQLTDLDVQLKTLINKTDFLKKEIASKQAGDAAEIIKRYEGKPYTAGNSDEKAFILYSDLIVIKDIYKEQLMAEIDTFAFSFRFIFESNLDKLDYSSELEKINDNLYKHGNIFRKIGTDDPALAVLNLQKTLDEDLILIDELKGRHEKLNDDLIFLKNDMDDIRSFCQKHTNEVKKLEIEYNTSKTTLKNIEEHKERTAKHLDVIDKEINISYDSIEKAQREVEKFLTDKDEYSALQAETEVMRVKIEEETEELNKKLEHAREQHASAQRELAKYTERKVAIENELKQLAKDKILTAETVQNIAERLKELSSVKMEEWRERLENAKADRQKQSKTVLEISELISDKEKKQQDIENHLYELRDKLSDINKAIHDIDLKIAEQQAKTDSTDLNLTALAEQMLDAYNIDIQTIWQEYSKKVSGRQQLTDMMQKIDQSIDNLGALNMAAEEEYNSKIIDLEVQTAQRADIEDAIVNLTTLITEIDESTVKLFEETFNAVRKNFVDVFNRFFGSGSADITLTDPENMLTTGVEITINPPGKKVNNKNLLSGGEKALSALTLLFALFLQKPTPFCFLDEVDAPLDDANVGRFIAMVNSMSDNTQFVIITHKHQTMASAHSLYGVTMQEGGVTSILSVELNKK